MTEENSAHAEKAPRLSEILMDYLLREKFYEQAAELALGTELVFEMYSRQIDEVIEDMERWPGRITFSRHLQPLIDKAHAEIQYERAWSQEVWRRLPDTSATAAIMNSFHRTAKARARLLNKLLRIHDRVLLVQQNAFSVSEPAANEGVQHAG